MSKLDEESGIRALAPTELWSRILQLAGRAGRICIARKMLNRIEKDVSLLEERHYVSVLDAIANNGDIEQAMRFILYEFKSELRDTSGDSLLSLITRSKEDLRAGISILKKLTLRTELNEQQRKAATYLLNSILLACLLRKESNMLLDVLQKMEAVNVEFDSVTYQIAMQQCLRERDTVLLEKFWKEMVEIRSIKPTSSHFKLKLLTELAAKQFSAAEKTLKTTDSEQIPLDEETLLWQFWILAVNRDERAMQSLERLIKSGYAIDGLSALLDYGQPQYIVREDESQSLTANEQQVNAKISRMYDRSLSGNIVLSSSRDLIKRISSVRRSTLLDTYIRCKDEEAYLWSRESE